ncbi:pilus assembly protein Flp/PilA [Acetoanaerobium noterae]|uniref:Pilus assembly protein Flp/PilA n=1 Tax=Acetoanaerobium noterae TaxID=745369 RepID=A0A1T5B105_9FIRM|nr:Flp family type IVb pilin [Acetoanaerobium noterae]SKB40895.1 pilus assembly protein Flp/PilA [Acetoanaerobium noterae]
MLDYMKALITPFISKFIKDEDGQGMVEYALIIAVIALVVVLAMPAVTDAISDLFDRIAEALAG